MHSRLTRFLTLFAIVLCLPLQGLASVSMPSCPAHGQQMEMHADQAEAMPHCDQHDESAPAQGTAGDNCFSCHINVTQAIIPFVMAVALNSDVPKVDTLTTALPDTVPSPLFHPPRPAFA